MLNRTFNKALAPDQPWKSAYATVEQETRKVLETFSHTTVRLTTTELVDLLYPKSEAWTLAVRKRLFKALAALAVHGMQRYVTLGPMEEIGPRKVKGQRKLWGPPTQELISPNKVCPTCHRPL